VGRRARTADRLSLSRAAPDIMCVQNFGTGGDMPHDALRLRLERVLPAPPGRVYALNTEPELLARWWGPNGFSVPNVEVDTRVGGRYRIEMQPPQGDSFSLSGEYLTVEPGTRLAYTFRWEPPDPDDCETVVELSLEPLDDESTALTIDQGDFATEARRALHLQGWSESIDHLEELIARQGPSAL
jgi:uncharacterized protein YndB with AHSA1/START domain